MQLHDLYALTKTKAKTKQTITATNYTKKVSMSSPSYSHYARARARIQYRVCTIGLDVIIIDTRPQYLSQLLHALPLQIFALPQIYVFSKLLVLVLTCGTLCVECSSWQSSPFRVSDTSHTGPRSPSLPEKRLIFCPYHSSIFFSL